MPSTDELKEAAQEGSIARRECLSVSLSPYQAGTKEGAAWTRGWLARDRMEKIPASGADDG